jgi:MFS superfamily sulfate permease-like transporter
LPDRRQGRFGLQTYGVASWHIPGFAAAHPAQALVAQLWPGALGIALMSFTETIAAGRAFAGSEEPPLRANQELLATGLANAGGALLGSMPAGGGTTQTAVNRLAGARTQLAAGRRRGGAGDHAPVRLIGLMPEATLAAVIIHSIGLIKPVESRYPGVRRMEFMWALAAFAGVVVLGTLKGILVAIVVSLVSIAYQTANPPVYVLGRKPGTNVFRARLDKYPEDETFPGLLLIRVEGRVFFANAERIADASGRDANPRGRFRSQPMPDLVYGLKMLTEAEKRQRDRGVTVWLVGLNPEVLATVQRSSLCEALGRERMIFNLELAVAKYLECFTAASALPAAYEDEDKERRLFWKRSKSEHHHRPAAIS